MCPHLGKALAGCWGSDAVAGEGGDVSDCRCLWAGGPGWRSQCLYRGGQKKKRVIIMINAIVKLPLLVLPVKSTVTLGPHIQCFSSKF